MKIITYDHIVNTVSTLCIQSNTILPKDSEAFLEQAVAAEKSPLGKSILKQCLENAHIARDKSIGICQDTGVAVFFVELGVDVRIEGKSGILTDAINDGVRKGYAEGYLRKSILSDPLFDRKNTGDNTPAIVHLTLVAGDSLSITITPKGGGAENMSALSMLTPSSGEEGVFRFVTETVIKAGGNPCPPVIVGVGIGGNFERCAYLAKKALTLPLESSHQDNRYAELENRILEKINESGLGPQGLGGTITALAVHILDEPCHLASLPVAVNINCHVHRHMTITL
ncbi:MAG TPA: fumarate hydratase [Spirochaetota bacterium]